MIARSAQRHFAILRAYAVADRDEQIAWQRVMKDASEAIGDERGAKDHRAQLARLLTERHPVFDAPEEHDPEYFRAAFPAERQARIADAVALAEAATVDFHRERYLALADQLRAMPYPWDEEEQKSA